MNEMDESQNDLNELRGRIDSIDGQIAGLLRGRFDAVKRVAAYKKAHGLEITQKSREAEVLARIAEIAGDDALVVPRILEVYAEILKASRSLQTDLNI